MAFPDIALQLQDHYAGRLYAIGSQICGNVLIRGQDHQIHQEIRIHFTGTIDLQHETVRGQRSGFRRPFIKTEISLASARQAFAKQSQEQTYTIPFSFGLPSRLTKTSCIQDDEHFSIQDLHQNLPSSVESYQRNARSPNSVRVFYYLTTSISCTSTGGKTRLTESKPVELEITSPVHVYENMLTQYVSPTMQVDAKLRRWRIMPDIGQIMMVSEGPAPVLLDTRRQSLSTVIQLSAYYETFRTSYLPTIESVSAKIILLTMTDEKCLGSIPQTTWLANTILQPGQRLHTHTRCASAEILQPLEWHQTISTAVSNQFKMQKYQQKRREKPKAVFHSPPILIKFSFHNGQGLIPTTHSCHVSRIYMLALKLFVVVDKVKTSVRLQLPLHITT